MSHIESISFYMQSYPHHRDPHSFPTRRSSDLEISQASARQDAGGTLWRDELNACAKLEIPDARLKELYDVAVSTLILDRKSTRLNSSHVSISYAVFCLKKKRENCISTHNCTCV